MLGVLRAGALGDVLLTFPALQALRLAGSDSGLHFIAPLPQGRLARWQRAKVDVVTAFDDVATALFGGSSRRPDALRHVDRAILWLTSSEEPRETLDRWGIECLVAAPPVPPAGGGIHAADWLMETLRPLGVSLRSKIAEWDRSAWTLPPAKALEDGRTQLRQAGLVRGTRYVVLHPGSGSARKNWPVLEWVRVLAGIDADTRIVCTAGPADEAFLDALLAACAQARIKQQVVPLRNLSLEALAGVLAGASLYLGNDSGVTHLAAAVGAPVVAVFGPTDPRVWRPRGPRVTVLGGVRHDGPGVFAPEAAWPEPEAVAQAALGAIATR